MSSPSVFRAPILLDEKCPQQHIINSDSYQQNKHSKKRRPVDPPEDLTFDQNDDYNDTNYTNKRRRTSPDDLLGTLSLKPPDPPAHSLCKRKKDDDDNDSVGNSSDGDDRRYSKQPRREDGDNKLQEDGTLQSKANDETTQDMSSSTKPDPPADITQQQNTSEIDNEMSIDDNSSINSNSDGSISEGSLQRAMYAAVFGRRNNAPNHFHSAPSTTSNHVAASGCCYDAVDSKIEEIIRRSRIEAEIRSRKEEKEATTTEKGVGKSLDLVDDDEKMEMDG